MEKEEQSVKLHLWYFIVYFIATCFGFSKAIIRQ